MRSFNEKEIRFLRCAVKEISRVSREVRREANWFSCTLSNPCEDTERSWFAKNRGEKMKKEGRRMLVTRAHRYSKKASASSKINRIIYESSFRIILCSVCSRDLLLFPSETHSTGRVFHVEIIVPLTNQALPSFRHKGTTIETKGLACFFHVLAATRYAKRGTQVILCFFDVGSFDTNFRIEYPWSTCRSISRTRKND